MSPQDLVTDAPSDSVIVRTDEFIPDWSSEEEQDKVKAVPLSTIFPATLAPALSISRDAEGTELSLRTLNVILEAVGILLLWSV